MATRAAGDTTQRELSYRKRLIEIANMINSAPSIQEILVDIKDKMLDLVDAERVTIFALDTKNQELFSLFKAGQEVKEIRVPKTFGSIAGFTRPLPQDRQHQERLRRRGADPAPPEPASSTRAGTRPPASAPTQVLASPILFEKYLLGVLQLINKRGRRRLLAQGRGGRRGAGEDPRHRLLQPAPRGAHQQAVQVRPPRGQGPHLGEGHREGGRRTRASTRSTWPRSSIEDYKIPKEEIGQRPRRSSTTCPFWEPAGHDRSPRTSRRG